MSQTDGNTAGCHGVPIRTEREPSFEGFRSLKFFKAFVFFPDPLPGLHTIWTIDSKLLFVITDRFDCTSQSKRA